MIPLSSPHIAGNEWKYIQECLDTQWVSSAGPFVTRFEKTVAEYSGAAHAVAVVNGTAALHIALQAAGVGPGDEVLVSDLTFVASANAILYCGAVPVFMDVGFASWQMDPAKVEAFLNEECELTEDGCRNKKTHRIVRAILPVHIMGFAVDMDRIVDLAKRFKLKVVEDAAEGIGVRFRGQHVGTLGDYGIFSFNGNKIVTCGGGGIVVCSGEAEAKRIRYLTTQAKDDPVEFLHKEMGYNYRLTNIQAALGVAQMEMIADFIGKKMEIAARYRRGLDRAEAFTHPAPHPECTPTYWIYTVLLDPDRLKGRKKSVISALNGAGIEARPFWVPMHSLPYLSRYQAYRIDNAQRLYECGVSLPSSVHLSEADQQKVCDLLNSLV